ncbi:MAG: DUF4440 domain-containing protein [Acidimicrobiales bacterium]|nr:DUF4440 domain-containing protein [Acidimicrobiales bacterium]
MTGDTWKAEIIELHELFEAYFLGTEDSLERMEAVIADDFTFIGPDGSATDRNGTLAAVTAGHGHTESLVIRTVDHQLLVETPEVVVAEYIEVHELSDRTNRRLSTVVFSRDPEAPNGLVWRRVHETWIDRGIDT